MKRIAIICLLLVGCAKPSKDAPVRFVILHTAQAHMPAALADSLGYYKDEGVAVTIDMVATTSKAAEALLAGSADVITGTYEQTLQLAAEGRSLRSFVSVGGDGRAMVALPNRSGIRSVKDLKGRTLGVPGPGSANHLFANYILIQNGLRLEDVSIAGVGTGRSAIAALERGKVDAGSVITSDLVYLKVKHPGLIVLADASTIEGAKAVYGSENYPTPALLARSEWLDTHPELARRIARAMKRTLGWLQEHSPEQIRDQMPEAYRISDREIDIEAMRRIKPIWSKDGVMPPDGPETVLGVMAVTNEKIRNGNIDLSKTYTNEFVKDNQ